MTDPGQPCVMMTGRAFWLAGADVDEVNVDPVDRRHELRQGIELRLRLAPVVAAAPVPNQLLQLGQLRALRLIGDGFLVGPSRGSNAPAEVVERGLRYLHFEGADGAILGRLARGGRLCDNDGVRVGACRGLSVAGRGEHKQADRERGCRTGKKVAPSRRRGQFLERHGGSLFGRGLSCVRFDSIETQCRFAVLMIPADQSCSANSCACVFPYGKKFAFSPFAQAARCSALLMSQSGRQRCSTARRSRRSSSTVGRPKNQ